MKLALVNPPEIPGYVSDRDKAGGIGVARPFRPGWGTPYLPPTPPMDWLYAAAIAEREKLNFRLFDAIGRRWDAAALAAEVRAFAPTHVGVRLSLPSLDEDLALADRLKAELPEAQVFLFGHASQTTYGQWLARSKADAVFFGEVEALLLPYLNGEDSPQLLVPGKRAFCAGWAYVEDLDALPYPAWHLIDRAGYTRRDRPDDFVYYILTSRGCPKGCNMCPYYVHQGKQWRSRSVESVMAEFGRLRELGAVRIQTRDPNISWRKPHLLAIAERLKGEARFRISTETDLEALNEPDLIALREAGFVRIMTGVESVDESIIHEIGQNKNALKRVLSNIEVCRKLGIEVTGFFIVGSLQESWASVRATVATARALPITYSVSLMTPYFGTGMREEFLARGFQREAQGFKQYNGYSGLVRTVGLDYGEVVLAHAWAAAELELVTRQRRFASATGADKLFAGLKLAKQAISTQHLRGRVAASERRPAAPSAPAASGAS